MAKQFLLIVGFLFSIQVMSQTGIGTTTPHASAKLDVSATNKGFLPPRVALTGVYDVSTIPSPATGLLVYCTGTSGLSSGYYFFNGTAWATIATEGGSGSVAAEFGAQFLSSNVSITSGTPVDVLSFTLPSAGTWEVITFLRAQGAAGYASEFAIYDVSNNLVPNSEILPAYGEIASTGTGVVRITTNGSAVYKVRAWASAGAFYVTSDFNGRTGVTWKKISGNAPVTGQSVDYVSVSTINQSSIGDNRDLIFTTNNGGNIPYNTSTGVFTLSANKTYLFQAQIRSNLPSAVGNYIEYGFVDATSNTLLVNGTQTITSSTTSTSGFGSNPVINFIYTPTSNQTVKLRTTATTVGTQNIVSGTANITQIGSSAIINPWTLSGTNTFNTTGNVGIGTNNPSNTLHLENGNSFGTDPGLTSSPSLYIYNNNNASTTAHSTLALRTNGDGGGNPYLSFDINAIRGYSMGIDNADGDKFKFHTNWSLNNSVAPAFTVTSENRFGIGTTAPVSRLHIKSSDMTSLYLESTSSDNYGIIQLNANTNQNWANNYHEFMFFQKQGTNIGSIVGSNGGNMVSYNTSSDYRLKTDFKNYNGLDLVNKVKTYNYSWKSDNSRMYGIIAHELQEVLPYAVSGQKDAVDESGKMIPQSVDYSKLTPILVKAVQEQDVKIKELQLQIEALLKRLEIVESKR